MRFFQLIPIAALFRGGSLQFGNSARGHPELL
jgi:hypothetical protein